MADDLSQLIVGTCRICRGQVTERDSWETDDTENYTPKSCVHSRCRLAAAERAFDEKYGINGEVSALSTLLDRKWADVRDGGKHAEDGPLAGVLARLDPKSEDSGG